MKDNLEKAKDILYNISDYLIMGSIVIAIGLIIAWRLDILFPQTTAMINTDTPPIKVEDNISKNIGKPETEVAEQDDKETKDSEVVPDKISEIINVSIPKGAPSSNIGNILVDQGLVKTTQEFEDMVQELDLEKSLRSGEFDIEKDSSVETIVKIIANKN